MFVFELMIGRHEPSPHSQRVNPQLPLELVLQPDKITLGRLTFPRMHEGYPICLHGTATPARIADCVPDSVGAALRERLATETLLSIACFPPVAPDALRSVIALGKPAGIPTTVANDCAPYLKAQGAVTEDANLPLWPVRADSASATKIEFEREYDLFAIEIASGAGHVSQVRVETEGGASTILDFDPDAPGFSRRPLVGMRGRTLTVNASAGRLAIAEIRVFGR
jgi:hypothetical protein